MIDWLSKKNAYLQDGKRKEKNFELDRLLILSLCRPMAWARYLLNLRLYSGLKVVRFSDTLDMKYLVLYLALCSSS